MSDIPGYQLLSQIYESANSEVYRGIREADNQAVILKVLKQDYPTPEELGRYKQEYQITCHLNYLKLDGVIKAYCLEPYQRTLVIFPYRRSNMSGAPKKLWYLTKQLAKPPLLPILTS